MRNAKDLVLPVKKQDIRPWSLGFWKLNLESKRKVVCFISMPRSGSTWVSNVIKDYFFHHYNIDRSLIFTPMDSRSGNIPPIRGKRFTRILGGHQSWRLSPLRGMDRCKAHIILIRDIPSAIYSMYVAQNKLNPGRYSSPLDVAKQHPMLDWLRELGKDALNCRRKPLIISYEDVKREPPLYFRAMIETISDESCDRDTLHSIIEANERKPVSTPYKGAVSYEGEMGAETYHELKIFASTYLMRR